MKRACSICGLEGVKVHSTFGKYKCTDCLQKSKTGRVGHSGMVYHEHVDLNSYKISDPSLKLIQVKKSDKLYVKWFVEHYPKSKGIVGRQLNYLIYKDGEPIGIIGFASPPLNYKKFNTFFNLEGTEPSEDAKLFLNNNIFRIVYSEPNLATKVLAIARKTILQDYLHKYGQKLKGIVTFVEPPRVGALYRADNWQLIGETQGVEVKRRGETWTDKQYIKTTNCKLIFGYIYKNKPFTK